MGALPWTKTIANALQVSVAPTSTVIVAAFAVRPASSGAPLAQIAGDTRLSIHLTNLDASQVLDAWLEASWDGSTGWTKLAPIGLDAMDPLEVRYCTVSVRVWRSLRLMGKFSGAGAQAKVSAEMIGESQ
jgi:hypothetical protein